MVTSVFLTSLRYEKVEAPARTGGVMMTANVPRGSGLAYWIGLAQSHAKITLVLQFHSKGEQMKLMAIAIAIFTFLFPAPIAAQNLMNLDDYEICGPVAIDTGSILSQRFDLERLGIFLNIDPASETVYRAYISAFTKEFPAIIAEENGISRQELSQRLSPMIDYFMDKTANALRNAQSGESSNFLSLVDERIQVLVHCADLAGIK